jgi:hypothetical protein
MCKKTICKRVMRKRIIDSTNKLNNKPTNNADQQWLNIDEIAIVEVTSEDKDFPIECALLPKQDLQWRASVAGKQVIRLIFDTPQPLKRIELTFEERDVERTQAFVLRWSSNQGESYQTLVEQQWNFSPEGSTSEVEEYRVELASVTTLELLINPNISDSISESISENASFASLKSLRLA